MAKDVYEKCMKRITDMTIASSDADPLTNKEKLQQATEDHKKKKAKQDLKIRYLDRK